MKAGVSTACFYPELTEAAMSWIAQQEIETAEVFFNSSSELEDIFLKELKSIADNGGTQIVSVHPFTSGIEPLMLFSGYERRVNDGRELFKRCYFHAANVLGAKFVVLHGERRDTKKMYERYFDMFGELALIGKSMGVTLAHENVPRCISWCPQFFREMSAYLPDAAFVLDTKQAIRGGFTALEMAEAMGSNVVHLHLSDHDDQRDCLPPGRGNSDILGLLRSMKSRGFDGAAILELYNSNYKSTEELMESYRFVKKLIATI